MVLDRHRTAVRAPRREGLNPRVHPYRNRRRLRRRRRRHGHGGQQPGGPRLQPRRAAAGHLRHPRCDDGQRRDGRPRCRLQGRDQGDEGRQGRPRRRGGGTRSVSPTPPAAVVEELVGFADTARREGLLALEEKVKAVEDDFLKRALEQVIDGSDAEAVEDTLHAEIDALKKRHAVGQKFWADAGAFAPTVGIIGTVVGLMHVMTEISHPEKLGPLIAGAFLATLWALLFANLFFLPISSHLKRKTALEVSRKELIIQGVLSIQAGASPRALGDRLKSSLAPKIRDGMGDKKAA